MPARSVSAGVIEHLEDHYFDLAVLSTHARTGPGLLVAASTSRRALRRAHGMTLFLREGQRGFVDNQHRRGPAEAGADAVDGKIAVADAVNKAKRLLERLGGGVELRLLHVGASAPTGCPKDVPLILAQGAAAPCDLQGGRSVPRRPPHHADRRQARAARPDALQRQRPGARRRALAGAQPAGLSKATASRTARPSAPRR